VGRPIGPKKVHRYSVEFKLTAVKLSGMPGAQVQTVAHALDVHPFMLSRWRREVRDGVLKGRASAGWSNRDRLVSSSASKRSSASTRCSRKSTSF
jgi:transposase-like protein